MRTGGNTILSAASKSYERCLFSAGRSTAASVCTSNVVRHWDILSVSWHEVSVWKWRHDPHFPLPAAVISNVGPITTRLALVLSNWQVAQLLPSRGLHAMRCLPDP